MIDLLNGNISVTDWKRRKTNWERGKRLTIYLFTKRSREGRGWSAGAGGGGGGVGLSTRCQ